MGGLARAARHGVVLLLLLLAGGGCRAISPDTDTRIEAEIKARLVAETTANLTRLGVLSHDGTVYLTGTVQSREAREQAERLTRSVTGVRRIVNGLEIRPTE
jgi:osmotically-inducible protein OsmY